MKRIIIICEGQTEQEFVKTVLQPFYDSKSIELQPPLIKASGGGVVKWQTLKKEIENYLKHDKSAIVTTFIDYYGLITKHDFPGWELAHQRPDKRQRMEFLEQQMHNEIDKDYNYRFIPYIQLHEFEALLFSDIRCIKSNISPSDFTDVIELDRIIEQYPNPEDINNNKETSPSHRLLNFIKGYQKVVYGNIIAMDTGLGCIREKNFRFDKWLSKLEGIV